MLHNRRIKLNIVREINHIKIIFYPKVNFTDFKNIIMFIDYDL